VNQFNQGNNGVYPNPEISPVVDHIQRFFGTIKEVLFTPTAFFTRKRQSRGLMWPMAYALMINWFAKTMDFIYFSFTKGTLDKAIQKILESGSSDSQINMLSRQFRDQQQSQAVMEWVLGIGSVFLAPFTTLIYIVFYSVVIFLLAKLIITEDRSAADHREITLDSIMTIFCFSMTPVVFHVIPFMGSMVAWIYSIILISIGIREFHRTDTARAVVVALGPTLLVFGLIFILILFIILLTFGLLSGIDF